MRRVVGLRVVCPWPVLPNDAAAARGSRHTVRNSLSPSGREHGGGIAATRSDSSSSAAGLSNGVVRPMPLHVAVVEETGTPHGFPLRDPRHPVLMQTSVKLAMTWASSRYPLPIMLHRMRSIPSPYYTPSVLAPHQQPRRLSGSGSTTQLMGPASALSSGFGAVVSSGGLASVGPGGGGGGIGGGAGSGVDGAGGVDGETVDLSALEPVTPLLGPDGLPVMPQDEMEALALAPTLAPGAYNNGVMSTMRTRFGAPPPLTALAIDVGAANNSGGGGNSSGGGIATGSTAAGGGGGAVGNSDAGDATALSSALRTPRSAVVVVGEEGGPVGAVAEPTSAAPPLLLQEMLVQTSRLLSQDRERASGAASATRQLTHNSGSTSVPPSPNPAAVTTTFVVSSGSVNAITRSQSTGSAAAAHLQLQQQQLLLSHPQPQQQQPPRSSSAAPAPVITPPSSPFPPSLSPRTVESSARVGPVPVRIGSTAGASLAMPVTYPSGEEMAVPSILQLGGPIAQPSQLPLPGSSFAPTAPSGAAVAGGSAVEVREFCCLRKSLLLTETGWSRVLHLCVLNLRARDRVAMTCARVD